MTLRLSRPSPPGGGGGVRWHSSHRPHMSTSLTLYERGFMFMSCVCLPSLGRSVTDKRLADADSETSIETLHVAYCVETVARCKHFTRPRIRTPWHVRLTSGLLLLTTICRLTGMHKLCVYHNGLTKSLFSVQIGPMNKFKYLQPASVFDCFNCSIRSN
jgi:hypothetical protein